MMILAGGGLSFMFGCGFVHLKVATTPKASEALRGKALSWKGRI
jgi:hypothetical protein